MSHNDSYLGDGVYASFDSYHIWLDLRAQDSTTNIALSPEVLAELILYAQRMEVLDSHVLDNLKL